MILFPFFIAALISCLLTPAVALLMTKLKGWNIQNHLKYLKRQLNMQIKLAMFIKVVEIYALGTYFQLQIMMIERIKKDLKEQNNIIIKKIK